MQVRCLSALPSGIPHYFQDRVQTPQQGRQGPQPGFPIHIIFFSSLVILKTQVPPDCLNFAGATVFHKTVLFHFLAWLTSNFSSNYPCPLYTKCNPHLYHCVTQCIAALVTLVRTFPRAPWFSDLTYERMACLKSFPQCSLTNINDFCFSDWLSAEKVRLDASRELLSRYERRGTNCLEAKCPRERMLNGSSRIFA